MFVLPRTDHMGIIVELNLFSSTVHIDESQA